MSVSYTLSRLEDRRIENTPDGPVTVTSIDLDNSSIRPIWQFNSVDNRFEPTTGQRLRFSLEYAGGVLGGTNYFIRPELAYTLFRPVTRFPVRTVFGFNLKAGIVEPFGTITDPTTGNRIDRGLSPLERYFLGGENSVRGHGFRSIFVRDDDGNPVQDPTFGTFGFGGDKFLTVSAEYHALLGGPFRLIAFVDGGNVYGDYVDDQGNTIEQDFDFDNLRWTAGLELRVLVPLFGAPLRFIYAFNLDELQGDEFDDFRFSIGTSF